MVSNPQNQFYAHVNKHKNPVKLNQLKRYNVTTKLNFFSEFHQNAPGDFLLKIIPGSPGNPG